MTDRREFITLLGGSAAWPFAAGAEQGGPIIGFLGLGSFEGLCCGSNAARVGSTAVFGY
jgi:hypothetical protein